MRSATGVLANESVRRLLGERVVQGVRLDELDGGLETRTLAGESLPAERLPQHRALDAVEPHGGRVWAEREGPGRGSTFVAALPVNHEVPMPAPVPAAS